MVDPSWWSMQSENLHIAVDTGNVGSWDIDLDLQNQTTDVGNGGGRGDVPTTFALMQNFPNPFNPTTEIRYALAEQCYTTLKVYDVLGREVTVLVNQVMPPGAYSIQWNSGTHPAGVYFYRLTAGNYTDTKKMLLVK